MVDNSFRMNWIKEIVYKNKFTVRKTKLAGEEVEKNNAFTEHTLLTATMLGTFLQVISK